MKRKHFRRTIKEKSRGYPILVISNTEPYIHKENEDRIECIRSINSYATDEFAQTIKKAFAVTPERFLGG